MECAAEQPIHAFASEVSIKTALQKASSLNQMSERSRYRIPRSGLVQRLHSPMPF
jgi:hypothetical protein